MSRKKSILGALVACALCMTAFSAASASASTWETCSAKGAGGGTGVLWNAGCTATEPTTGPNETYPIPVTVPPTATPVTITGTSEFTLSATVGGVAFDINCTGLESPGATITNTAGSPMTATGTGKSKFTGCTTKKPAGNICTVSPTLETVELASKAEGTKIKYTPSGGTFITIVVGGASCPAALKGEKAVQGTATSEAKPGNMVTQQFTSTSGSALTFGGQVATFTGEYHGKITSTGVLFAVAEP